MTKVFSKKSFAVLATCFLAALLATLSFTGCSSDSGTSEESEDKTITVAASPTPHARNPQQCSSTYP